jgi:ABC-type multidrug transport system fused ATPase/permease subunit
MSLPKEENKRFETSLGFKNLKFLSAYIMPYKWVFALGFLSLAISAGSTMIIPKLIGSLVDQVSEGETVFKQLRNQFLYAALILLAIQGIFSYIRVYTFTYVTEKGMGNVRRDLYNKIMRSNIEFFDKTRVGELMSRITSDVVTLQDTFSINLAELIRQIITLLVGTILLFIISWKLSLTMLLALPIFVFLALLFGRFIKQLSKTKQDAIATSNVYAEEAFTNIRVVQAFNQEITEQNKYSAAVNIIIGEAIKGARYRGAFISFMVIGLFGIIFLLFYQAANLAHSGVIDNGDLIEFLFYTGFIGGSIAGLGDLASKFQGIIGSTERIISIMRDNNPVDSMNAEPLPLDGSITLSNVDFRYPSRQEIKVLDGITFQVHKGESVALVGHSGAGKSTIFQLLLQYYYPDSGGIYFDEYLSSHYHPSVVRSHISVVPQEVILFGGTIAENIAYGKPTATKEEIIQAAKEANAYDFIMQFPDGLETVVGERGIKLSGGQRQRVAIARAILKNPKILLLDEATSALDAESEKLIQEALDRLMRNRTTIIIAHRLSTIRNADRILVMNKGKIIESGNHDELSQNEDGLYTHLLKLQYQLA